MPVSDLRPDGQPSLSQTTRNRKESVLLSTSDQQFELDLAWLIHSPIVAAQGQWLCGYGNFEKIQPE